MNLPATVRADGSAPGPARLVDLGLGGACVSVPATLADRSPVTLVVDAPHLWDPLEITGVVAWSREDPASAQALVGVKFERASAATLRKMAELLETTLF